MTDEITIDTRACIEHTAFEAAYLEMNPPDPASRHFAKLVARHRKRLWAEHLMWQGEQPPGRPGANQTDELGGW